MVIMVDVLPARTSVGSDVGGVGMTATDEAIQASCNAVTIDGKPQEEVDGKSPAVTGKKTTKTVEGETKKPVDGKMEMADTNAEASTGEKLDTEGKSATELSAMARDAVEKGGDWETVIDLHAKALQVMIENTGDELAPECASYYFDYGDAVLQQCCQRSEVFGSVIKQKAAEAAAAKEQQEGGGEKPETEPAEAEDEEEEECESGAADAEEDIEADADEPTDLQVAWELIETARVIYSRMGESPVSAQMGLADCYSRLGDLALENDGDAMSDYTSCLNTLKSINESDADESVSLSLSRSLSSIHFKIAVCKSIAGESPVALEHFTSAKSSLSRCAQILLGTTGADQGGKGEASVQGLDVDTVRGQLESVGVPKKSQLRDLIELMEQIQEKIEDIEASEPIQPTEILSMVQSVMADAAAPVSTTTAFNGSTSSSAPVNDLGAIVGQKRKLQVEAVGDEDAETKRVATMQREEKDA